MKIDMKETAISAGRCRSALAAPTILTGFSERYWLIRSRMLTSCVRVSDIPLQLIFPVFWKTLPCHHLKRYLRGRRLHPGTLEGQ